MKLSTKSRYGTRLMLDMAQHYQDGPIHLANVAKRQGISVKYLEQIIIPLKKANYIQSVRGPKGGHILARPPGRDHGRRNRGLAGRGRQPGGVFRQPHGLRAFLRPARPATSGRRRPRPCLTNCSPLPWPIC